MKNNNKIKMVSHTKDRNLEGYYKAVKKCSIINPIDYDFLFENYKLTKKDMKLFLSKPVYVENSSKFTDKQFTRWVIESVQRCDKHPTLKDYYSFENLISSY